MRVIAHVSDLHFGRTSATAVAALHADLKSIKPDVVVASGDFTQRARRAQFKEAREFLRALPCPFIAVPGNHDVPLFDVVRRFLSPLRRFRHFISRDLLPFYEDEEVAILGINTARSLTWKEGRVSQAQMRAVEVRFKDVAPQKLRLLVAHHPFFAFDNAKTPLVGRVHTAMKAVAKANVDVLMTGHVHVARSHALVDVPEAGLILVQAGTAISTRTRHDEKNAYNVLRVAKDQVEVEVRVLGDGAFDKAASTQFARVHRTHPAEQAIVT